MTRKTTRLGKPAVARKGVAAKATGVPVRGQQNVPSPHPPKATAHAKGKLRAKAPAERRRREPPVDGTAVDEGRITPPPFVQVELDAEASSGFIHGRFDIQLRGRVAAAVAVESLELLIADSAVGRSDYGESSRAPAVTLPDGTPGRERGFLFTLQRQPPKVAGTHTLRVRVIGHDGPLHDQEFTLAIDPTGPEPVQITAGPRRPLLSLSATRPPIILYVERATLTDQGGFLLHGWALAMNPLVTVQAYLGEQRLSAAQLGVPRDDVAAHYTGYPNARTSGFSLIVQTDPAQAREVQVVRVQAISRGGFSHQVIVPLERVATPRHLPAVPPQLGTDGAPLRTPAAGAPTLEGKVSANRRPPQRRSAAPEQQSRKETSREIRYFCDEARFQEDGTLLVVGWAVCAEGLREIVMELDGAPVGAAELGLPRPDVGEEFAAIPWAGAAGFRFEQSFPDIAEGQHELRIILRNEPGDERCEVRELRAAKPIPGARKRSAARTGDQSEFRFELDSPQVVAGSVVEPVAGRLTIEGWALARSGVEGVEISLDGQRLGDAHYGLARQDVGAAFPDWDNALRSGYAFHCPPRALRDGEHMVKLEVRAQQRPGAPAQLPIDVKKTDADDQFATIRRRIGHVESAMQAELLDSLGYRPDFHLLLRQGSGHCPRRPARRHWRPCGPKATVPGVRPFSPRMPMPLSQRVCGWPSTGRSSQPASP